MALFTVKPQIKSIMNHFLRTFAGIAILLSVIFTGCSNEPRHNKEKVLETLEAERGEHSRDVEEKGEGEEDGTQFSKNDIYDEIKNGAHLVLSYNTGNNSFTGTVENVTQEVIKKVRVEVHLSSGIELGPTTSKNLNPGEKILVELNATEKAFETWSTHAEVGSGEHGNEGGDGEHGEEGGELSCPKIGLHKM